MSTKNGNSKSSSTPQPSSVPKRNLGKRLHRLNPQSRLEDVSSGHTCTDRFTELVSCNRGYGSVALYAVFSIFILAFLYVIWKIVSAHTSRSGHARRPGPTNSSSATKIAPTAHSLNGNVTSLKWMQKERGAGTISHIVHYARPQNSKGRGPKRLKIHLTDDNKKDRIQSISRDNQRDRIQSINIDSAPPRYTIPTSTTNPPTSLPTSQEEPLRNYFVPTDWITSPSIREPAVVEGASLPADYSDFFRPNRENDFFKGEEITAGIGRSTQGTSDYDDSRKREWLRWEAKRTQMPGVSYGDLPARGPYRSYRKQNLQDVYDLTYHGDDRYREIPHNPGRPRFLSSFDGDSAEKPSNRMRTEHIEKTFKTKEKPYQRHSYHRYFIRHRKHHNRQGSFHERKSFRNNVDEVGHHRERELSRHTTEGHHHHHFHQHQPRIQFQRLIHHKRVKHRHDNIYLGRQAHRHHHNYIGYKNKEEHRTALKEKHRKAWKPHPRGVVQFHTRKPVHRLVKHVSRSSLKRHKKHGIRHHSNIVPKHTIPKPSKPVHPPQRPRVHVLGYRRYLQYRRHHSFQEESRGKWRKSRHRIRTCKTLHTSATTGMVKLSRTKYKSKFLYTLLVCKPVRFRIHRHRRKLEVRRVQLCHNRWYITRGLIHVKKTIKSPAIPSYTVRLCTHSYARKMKLKSRFGEAKHKSTTSRHGARKFAAKHRRHHAKKVNQKKHRKTRKKLRARKSKKTVVHKHKKAKRLRHKSAKNHHIHHVARKAKETRKNSGVTKKDFIHRNPSGKRSKQLNAKGSSRNDFFVKLMQVLKLAKQNQTTHGDVFESLEHAVKRIIQRHRPGKHHENATKNIKESAKVPKNSRGHINSKATSVLKANMPNVSKEFIQNVLAKVLPFVLQSVKSNSSSEVRPTVATAKTAKPTTKPKPTTKTKQINIRKPTTKTKQTNIPEPTTKAKTTTVTPSGGDMEAVLKSILPLLLKKAHQPQATQATTTKPTVAKTTTAPTEPKSKKIKDLLASLGLGSLDLGSLGKLNTKTKPTQKVPDTTRMTSTATPTTRTPWAPELPLPTTRRTLPPPPPPPPPPLPKPRPLVSAKPVQPPSALIPNRNVATIPNPFTKHILCFGDSLTNGFYNHGKNFHPYSIRLNQLLNSNGQGMHYHVDTSGKVGEMVHGSMTKRFPMVLGNTSQVDWAIILGGTNDVAHVKNFGDDDAFMTQLINVWKPKIVQDILSLHQTAYRFGARTVLLTIPESAYEAWPSFKTLWVMRTAINQDLREFAQNSHGKTVLCDLAIKLPRHTLPAKAQALLWNDHLHPTPYGYDRMADIIYQCMKPYLRR